MCYEIAKTDDAKYFLQLKKLDNRIYSQSQIEIIEDSLFNSLPSFIQSYLLQYPQHRQAILTLIDKILSFSPDIRMEVSTYYSRTDDNISKTLVFAKYNRKGAILNNKVCAEFTYYYQNNTSNGKLCLSVYLPTVAIDLKTYKRRKLVDSILVDTDDFIYVKELRDLNVVLSRLSGSRLIYPLKTPEIDRKFSSFIEYYLNYRKYMKSRKKLKPVTYSDFTSVAKLVQMALEDWSVR